MPRTPADDASDTPDPQRLLAKLRDGDVDAAIDAGLMRFDVESAQGVLDAEGLATVLAARRRLETAWQARERFVAREARLSRIARERAERRSKPAPTTASQPALPAAAASALARALAKASGTRKA